MYAWWAWWWSCLLLLPLPQTECICTRICTAADKQKCLNQCAACRSGTWRLWRHPRRWLLLRGRPPDCSRRCRRCFEELSPCSQLTAARSDGGEKVSLVVLALIMFGGEWLSQRWPSNAKQLKHALHMLLRAHHTRLCMELFRYAAVPLH